MTMMKMMIWGNLVTLALPSYQWQCFCARSVPGMRKVAIHPAALVWNHDAPGILLLCKLWTTICDMTGLPTWHNSLVWLQQNLKTTNIFKMQKIFRFKIGQESFKSIFTRPLPSSSMFGEGSSLTRLPVIFGFLCWYLQIWPARVYFASNKLMIITIPIPDCDDDGAVDK